MTPSDYEPEPLHEREPESVRDEERTAPDVKLRNISDGEADVEIDGHIVGFVQYREERYNLIRLIVGRYWDGYLRSGDDRTRVVKGAATRREAVRCLVTEHLDRDNGYPFQEHLEGAR